MKIGHKQFLRYFYISVLILWIITSIHIFYLYTVHISSNTPVKGGTLVEATFDIIKYLPYTSTKNEDKFYQSFLYKSCLTPYVSGTQILFEENLCSIETQDYKTYKITIKDGNKWSDMEDISIEDVYFTYNDIIKENSWEIPSFNNFSNLDINLTGELLTIIFPISSLDNNIFFTNFILPSHSLKGMTRENYINEFSFSPVKSNCANIETNINDTKSYIFNLSECDEVYIKYYQVKHFSDINEFSNYISENKFIDIYISNLNFEGFNKNKVILNQFISLFFNTKSDNLNTNERKSLAKYILDNIYTGNYNEYFVKDNFLFDANIEAGDISKIFADKLKAKEKEGTIEEKEVDMKDLPSTIVLSGNSLSVEYYLDDFKEFKALKIQTLTGYNKVSVNYNNKGEYFLKAYNSGSKNIQYNIATSFNNISTGKNLYIIKGYGINDSKGEIITNINLYYKEKPITQIINKQKQGKLKIVYFASQPSKYIASKLGQMFIKLGINDLFEFIEINTAQEFEGKIQSQDYEMAIRAIDMGIKKDISTLFMVDDPNINPSMYKNNELANFLKQYFISNTKKEIKEELDKAYARDVPFIMLGKVYGNINTRKTINFSYPERLYDYWFRKDYLGDIKLSYKPTIENEKLFNLNNFISFISQGIK